jgi:hypothetical protein
MPESADDIIIIALENNVGCQPHSHSHIMLRHFPELSLRGNCAMLFNNCTLALYSTLEWRCLSHIRSVSPNSTELIPTCSRLSRLPQCRTQAPG